MLHQDFHFAVHTCWNLGADRVCEITALKVSQVFECLHRDGSRTGYATSTSWA